MNYQVLKLDESWDRWRNLVYQVEKSDIYYTPGYCKIYQNYGDGEGVLFVFESGNGTIIYPFFLRDISSYENINIKKSEYYDILSPYGYGGPLVSSEENEPGKLLADFRGAFHDYCSKNNVITEFIRFHPLLRNHENFEGSNSMSDRIKVEYIQDTVMVDLRKEKEQIWDNYTSRNRNSIRKGGKNGIEINFHSGKEVLSNLENFHDLYISTMKYREASNYYLFPMSFLEDSIRFLGGNLELAFAKYQDEFAAGSLFLLKNKYAHYHLSGTNPNYYKYAPNNIMLHRAALRYKKEGYKSFHLGGGHSGNDSLFKFKKSFSKRSEDILSFYIGKAVHDKNKYRELNDIWLSNNSEVLKKNDIDPQEIDYFPLYRANALDIGEK